MNVSYQLWLRGKDGTMLLDLTDKVVEFEWIKVANDRGMFAVTLPETVDKDMFQLDGRVEIWRKGDSGLPLRIEQIGFIRRFFYKTDEGGVTFYRFSGPDLNDLLARRIIYPFHNAGGGVAGWTDSYTDYADNLMRHWVRDNLGASNDMSPTGRDIVTSNTAGITFSIEADPATALANAAGTMTQTVALLNLLAGLQQIHKASKTYVAGGSTAAVPVYFDIVPDDYNVWTFKCFANRIGNDHSSDSGQPVMVSRDFGNLATPSADLDRNDETTAAYVQYGERSYRGVETASDTARTGESPFNRREVAGTETEILPAAVKAAETMNHAKASRRFTGNMVNTDGCAYGVHWGFGDAVTVSYLGEQYDARVQSLQCKVTRDAETIDVTLEAEA